MEELIACKKAVGKVVSGAPNVSELIYLSQCVALLLLHLLVSIFRPRVS